MSVFKTGFHDYNDDLQGAQANQNKFTPEFRLKVGEVKQIIILDDTGFRFNQHTVDTGSRRPFRSIHFTGTYDDKDENSKPDILTKASIKRSLVTVMTCKDLTGYRKSDGSIVGVNERKILILKPSSAKILEMTRQTVAQQKAHEMWEKNRQRCEQEGLKSVDEVMAAIYKKGNILKNVQLSVGRTDGKSAGTGNFFNFVRWVKQDELSQEDIPFNYEEIFAVKPEDQTIKEINQFHLEHNIPNPYDWDAIKNGSWDGTPAYQKNGMMNQGNNFNNQQSYENSQGVTAQSFQQNGMNGGGYNMQNNQGFNQGQQNFNQQGFGQQMNNQGHQFQQNNQGFNQGNNFNPPNQGGGNNSSSFSEDDLPF